MKKSILLLLSISCACLQASVGGPIGRSVVSPTPATAPFAKMAFAGNNLFFLGAGTATAGNKEAVACAKLARANGVWTVPFTALADTASVNDAAVTKSPLQGQQITNMALLGTDATTNGRLPVVTDAAEQKVYVIAQPLDGSDLRRSGVLKDAANADVSSIVGVAATAELELTLNGIFAAVAPNGGTWSGGVNHRGVALLSVDADPANGLVPTNAQAVNLDVTALEDGLDSDQPIAFKPSSGGINNAVLGAGVDMVWDQALQCFYMGLSTVTRDNNTLTGGVLSIVVGKYNSTEDNVVFSPIFDPAGDDPANFFSLNTPDGILGFNYDGTGNKPATANAYKVRVMHTSTGRSYLIMNGGVTDDANNSNKALPLVYALPLVDATGQLAQVNADTYEFEPVTADNMKTADAVDVQVGVTAAYLVHDLDDNDHQVTINNMQVVGDTVYVSVAGTRTNSITEEQGIFASTAIFDQYGVIRAWTPWQRVMGNITPVSIFAFDEKGSNYWFTDIGNRLMNVTRWDAGATNIHTDAAHLLSTVLQPSFVDNSQGGVYGLFNFDDQTSGFKPYEVESSTYDATVYPQFSMMIATGYNRVAMIETGRADEDGVFQQTKSFDATVGSATQNVLVFNDTTLPDLGAITAAEVARVAPSDDNDAAYKGWVFVGGEYGIAVLRNVNDGSGWVNGAGQGLAQLKGAVATDYPGGANFAFEQIAYYADQVTPLDITNVRKLVSDGTYLYILTNNALSRLKLSVDTMLYGYLANDNDYQIPLDLSIGDQAVSKALSNETAFTFMQGQDEFFDMVLVKKNAVNSTTVLVIATTGGLVEVVLTDATGQMSTIRTVLVNSTQNDPNNPSLGPVLRLGFVSQLRGGQLDENGNAQGNLYALAMDNTWSELNMYRFDVSGANVNYFTESYMAGGDPTDYFYRIGDTHLFAQHEFSGQLDFVNYTRHFGDLATYFVDNMPLVPPTDNFLQTNPINLNQELTYWPHLGTKILDTASGAVYVPGEFGVRVNE